MHLRGIAAVSGVVACLTACASAETTATDHAAVTTAPSSSSVATTGKPTPASPSARPPTSAPLGPTTPPAMPAPPPVTVQPFTFARSAPEEPRAELPPLPTDNGAAATLSISDGWTGGLQTSGPPAERYVRCQVISSAPQSGYSYLQYEVSSDGRFSEFGVAPGQFYVRIIRHDGFGDRLIDSEIQVFTSTVKNIGWTLWDSTGTAGDVNQQPPAFTASPDNRTIAFAAAAVANPVSFSTDPAGIVWTLVQGTVSCPHPPGAIPGV